MDNKDADDQTARMHRLICVFVVRIWQVLYIFSTNCLLKLAWSVLADHFKIALINLYMLMVQSIIINHYQLDEFVSNFIVAGVHVILFPIEIPVSKQCRPWSDT